MAKIDTSLIEGFAEMSAEEQTNALLSYEFEVPEDLSGKVAEQKKMIDDYSSQLATYKRKKEQVWKNRTESSKRQKRE